MNETVLSKIINEFDKELKVAIEIGNKDKIRIIKHLTNIAKTHLPIERKQIIDAYWGGLNGAINDYSDNKIKHGGGAEYYYNQTFKP